ncbi:HNH endonuclease [Micromonospora aurantiaca (nom. illeg.)]|uniref:HNH endonuclease n=1 Tax=Micromonospora aurantiaca (nom. illeg.) TaxID=47850 RepID=UPI0016172AD6
MTRPLRPGEIGYRGTDDVVLRGALYEVWKSRCAFCTRPQAFYETQIDHVIAKTTTTAELQELIDFHGLTVDFHLHRPGNLVLICTTCNTKKGKRNLQARSISLLLDEARSYTSEVDRLTREHVTARKVAKGLITAVRANLKDPKTCTEFLDNAPAIVQTLAVLDERKAADYLVDRSFDLDGVDVSLSLNALGRTAEAIIASLCSGSLSEATADGVAQVLAKLTETVTSQFHRRGSDDADWRPTESEQMAISLDFSNYARRGDYLEVNLEGVLSAEFVASAAQSNDWGDGLVDLAAWGIVDCTFALALRWDLRFEDEPDADIEVEITEIYSDHSVTRN